MHLSRKRLELYQKDEIWGSHVLDPQQNVFQQFENLKSFQKFPIVLLSEMVGDGPKDGIRGSQVLSMFTPQHFSTFEKFEKFKIFVNKNQKFHLFQKWLEIEKKGQNLGITCIANT